MSENVLSHVASEAGLSFNVNGDLTTFGATTYGWTWDHRMVSVAALNMTATYDYDADDRRTVRTVSGATTRTLWSGADEVGEYDASGALLRRFIPDGSGAMDARLAAVEADGTVTWLHTNHQGSVVATSNASGAVRGWASYSPSGELATGLTAPPPGSPFGYTGRQWDAETGLWQYRARYYSPRLGQFLSTDPIGMRDDPNLYLYVGLDPVNNTDPTGMCGKTRGDAQSQQDQCVGRWSAPTMPSSAGQSGSALEGERSIQDHYAGFSGEPYTVDPQAMQMGSSIDIGSQLQSSINNPEGSMRSAYLQAYVSGEPVSFSFGTKRFSPELWGQEGPAGRSVGRFAGEVRGTIIVDEDGTWVASGTISLSPDTYSWTPDGTGLSNLAIIAGGVTTNMRNGLPNYVGREMRLNYNRNYEYDASGRAPF